MMKKSMYGTRDAASNWERDWQENVEKWGFQLGLSSKNLFHHKEHQVSGLTHGDDLVLTGPTKRLMEFKKEMTKVYPTEAKIISFGSPESIKTLNRRLHWGREGIVYQHDPRHVDVLVKELGLENGNTVQTPAAPVAAEEEESEVLSQTQHHRYRSQVARCLFLSQDRADITFIVNELCQTMSSPTLQSMAKLKRLTRYLKRERQWGQVFKYEKTAEEVTMFTDSDWVGCKETRKSSSAVVAMSGAHALKAYTRKQKIIARSSAEAELYAAAFGASELKGIISLMRDLGYEKKPVLAIDAKAIEHILHRQGIGKLQIAGAQSQKCGQHRRSGNKIIRKGSDCEALRRNGMHEHESGRCPKNCHQSWGVLKHWKNAQQVTMSRNQAEENRSSGSIRSSGSKQAKTLDPSRRVGHVHRVRQG